MISQCIINTKSVHYFDKYDKGFSHENIVNGFARTIV